MLAFASYAVAVAPSADTVSVVFDNDVAFDVVPLPLTVVPVVVAAIAGNIVGMVLVVVVLVL